MKASSRSVWIALSCLLSLLATIPAVPHAGALTMSPGTASHDVGTNPVAIAVGDVDRDGTVDLAVANRGSGDVSILLGDGAGGLRPGSGPIAMGAEPHSVALGDLNRDGVLDLVAAGSGASKVRYRMGDGTGGFRALKAALTGSTPPAAMAIADLNADHKLDMITANPASSSVSVLLGGAFDKANGSPYSAAVAPDAIAVGDMNGDGHNDVVVSSATSDGVSVLLGNGKGRLVFASRHGVGTSPVSVRLGDIDGDGHLDAVVGRRVSNEIAVMSGNGAGGFKGSATTYPLPAEPRAVAVADVNGDAHPDVLATSGAPSDLTILLGDAEGGLVAASGGPWPLDGEAAALVAPDLDGDGLGDVVVARADAGDVAVFLNGSRREVSPSVDELDFGSQPRGTTSSAQMITLSGTGLPVAIGGVAIEGGGFAVAEDGCSGHTVGDGRAPCVISVRFHPEVAGEHAATVRITSEAADSPTVVALLGTGVDTDPPETTITARPSDPTTETTPTFSFASSEAASTFECSLDGDEFAPCVSPHTTAPLPPGSHTFAVRATNAAGYTDPTPASYTFTVLLPSTTPPETTITEHPPALSNDTTPTFRFISDSSGSSFRCSMDDGEPVDCASPYTSPALVEGRHTFTVAAVNASGTIDPTPDAFEFVIDTTAPRTKISGPRRATKRNARYTFRFSEDVAEVRCSVDGSGFSVCKTPYSARSLRVGKHVLRVQAVDAAGNVEEPAAVKRFRIVRRR